MDSTAQRDTKGSEVRSGQHHGQRQGAPSSEPGGGEGRPYQLTCYVVLDLRFDKAGLGGRASAPPPSRSPRRHREANGAKQNAWRSRHRAEAAGSGPERGVR